MTKRGFHEKIIKGTYSQGRAIRSCSWAWERKACSLRGWEDRDKRLRYAVSCDTGWMIILVISSSVDDWPGELSATVPIGNEPNPPLRICDYFRSLQSLSHHPIVDPSYILLLYIGGFHVVAFRSESDSDLETSAYSKWWVSRARW